MASVTPPASPMLPVGASLGSMARGRTAPTATPVGARGRGMGFGPRTTTAQPPAPGGASVTHRAMKKPPTAAVPQPAPSPTFQMGDVDHDGKVDASDGHALLSYLFSGGATPAGLTDADYNGDGAIDIADAIQIIASDPNFSPPKESAPPPPPPATSPFQTQRARIGYHKVVGLPGLPIRP